jgi:hypothetical protein
MAEKGVRHQRDLPGDASEFGKFKFCAASEQMVEYCDLDVL